MGMENLIHLETGYKTPYLWELYSSKLIECL